MLLDQWTIAKDFEMSMFHAHGCSRGFGGVVVPNGVLRGMGPVCGQMACAERDRNAATDFNAVS